MSLREQRRSTVDRQTQGWQAKIKDEFSSWGLAWGYENNPSRLLLHLIINSIYARVATYHIVGARLSAELTANDEKPVPMMRVELGI